MILVGGIVGAAWGFRENEFIIPEGRFASLGTGPGSTSASTTSPRSTARMASPLDYRSDVTLLRDGEPIQSGSMTVNNPLTFGDIVFYQSGFGQAVALRVADGAGQVLFDDALPLGPFQSQLNPDAPAARMDLVPAGVALSVIAPDENPANAPELDTLNCGRRDVLHDPAARRRTARSRQPIGATVGQGDSIQLGDLSFTFVRERRFSVLQVARNPGIPIFIAASVLLVGGWRSRSTSRTAGCGVSSPRRRTAAWRGWRRSPAATGARSASSSSWLS